MIKENKSVILKIFFIVLNLPYYIYKKLSRNKNKFTISSRIIKISTISVSIGILVTLISFSIGKGLQIEIKNKMFSIQSDIIISSYENIETGISLNPINKSNLLNLNCKRPATNAEQKAAMGLKIVMGRSMSA